MNPPAANPRTAVVLLNLGGPDSLEAVEPFLFNLFSDPDIFKLPLAWLTQKPFARMISRRRAPEASEGYAALGGRSPILQHTQVQADALQAQLGDGFQVFICMRYWHPRADEVVRQLKAGGFQRVLLLPLYPQYSHTTTGSSFNDFRHSCRRYAYAPEVLQVENWYAEPGYHRAIATAIEHEVAGLPDPDPANIELLFSAHGLPQKLVDKGDPYRDQIEATYRAVSDLLGWPHSTLCYQSRVGPLEWLRPYTDDVIRAKATAGCKQMLVYPIAFVSDHVETLFELGMTYAALAKESGITDYRVVPALNADPGLVTVLADLVRRETA